MARVDLQWGQPWSFIADQDADEFSGSPCLAEATKHYPLLVAKGPSLGNVIVVMTDFPVLRTSSAVSRDWGGSCPFSCSC